MRPAWHITATTAKPPPRSAHTLLRRTPADRDALAALLAALAASLEQGQDGSGDDE